MHHRTSLQFSSPINFEQVIWKRVFPFLLSKVLNYMVKIWPCEEELFHHKSSMILKMSNKLIAVFLLSSRKTLSREVLSFIAKLALVRTESKGWQAVSSTHLLRIPKIKLSAQKQDFQCSTQVRNITNQSWEISPIDTGSPDHVGIRCTKCRSLKRFEIKMTDLSFVLCLLLSVRF